MQNRSKSLNEICGEMSSFYCCHQGDVFQNTTRSESVHGHELHSHSDSIHILGSFSSWNANNADIEVPQFLMNPMNYKPSHNVSGYSSREAFTAIKSDYVQRHIEKSESLGTPHIKTDLPNSKNTSSNKMSYVVRRGVNIISKRKNRVLICKFNNCNKEFTKMWGLCEHYRVHTREKPFSCENCKTRFSQKGSLIKHVRKNTLRGCLHC